MNEIFVCPACGNHNLINWEGRDETAVFPCLGCCWSETFTIIKMADDSTERLDRNNPVHMARVDEAGADCLDQAILPHGHLMAVERGKGETPHG